MAKQGESTSLADATEKMQFRVATGRALKRAKRDSAEKGPLSLVTGAGGRLGQYLVKALIEKGDRVRALHRPGKPQLYPAGVEVFEGSLADRKALQSAVDGVDYVYHLAALVNHSAPIEALLDANYRGTANLLEACKAKAYRLKRFIYISSISVYGKEIEELPANERTEPNPTDNYGKSKLMAEQVVMQYSGRMPTVILRPAVVYGRGFNEAYLQVLGALESGKMPIIDGGRNVIPFVHVLDVVQAMLLAVDEEKAVGNAYVISGGENLTQKQIFEIACRKLGVPPPRNGTSRWMLNLKLGLANFVAKFVGNKPAVTGEYLDVIATDRSFDISKARKELGYSPKIRLEEGIGEMVEYYRSVKGG